MLTAAEKEDVVRRAKIVLRTGEFVDMSAGTVIAGQFFPSIAVRLAVRIDDVQIDGSFNGKDNVIWMDIRVGSDHIYGEGGSAAGAEFEPHDDKWVHALEILRRAMVLDDLAGV
jgi:hypothetical protein